mmetsp:Transcript_28800/g.73422  ORF Transcript_28800/g.73422 Transcript_28800/m.73422 type:complete len:430 (+) Transcript_28800:1168-2457(+)
MRLRSSMPMPSWLATPRMMVLMRSSSTSSRLACCSSAAMSPNPLMPTLRCSARSSSRVRAACVSSTGSTSVPRSPASAVDSSACATLSAVTNEHHSWQNCCRICLSMSRYVPWSSSTTSNGCLLPPSSHDSNPGLPFSRTMRLPGCGSACMNPSTNVSCAYSLTSARPTARGLMWRARRPSRSLILTPAIHSMTRMRGPHSRSTMMGTDTRGLPTSRHDRRDALRTSVLKSSSTASFCSSSVYSQPRCRLGNSSAATVLNSFMTARSAATRAARPGYCTLTATSSPVTSRARCTCASEAAAVAVVSNSENSPSASLPSSARSTRLMSAYGLGVALSSSWRSSCLYSTGTAPKAEANWPALMYTPPLARHTESNSLAQRVCSTLMISCTLSDSGSSLAMRARWILYDNPARISHTAVRIVRGKEAVSSTA